MMIPLRLLILCLFAVSCTVAQQTITTKSGPVRGKLIRDSTSVRNLTVYQFSAIPFAEPPLGDLRYRKPTPVRSWTTTTILDASRTPKACIQSTAASAVASEDCLYLNIWVPNDFLDLFVNGSTKTLMSTYVYIHGGAFIEGSAYNGSILAAANNIIVVSIQYRLGSLGFAYLGTEDVPGNMGMWDQVEALKWIYENIASFGGNNSEITIGGESAGAASVTFHLLSPYSRKYFQRAVVESGAAIAPWATHTPQQATTLTNAMFQGVANKCSERSLSANSSASAKTQCLKTLNASVISSADQMVPFSTGIGIPFTPVIDGDFLPRDSYDMLQSGDFYKVPLLIGANRDEGSMFLALTPMGMQLLPLPQAPNRTIDDTTFNNTIYTAMVEDAFRTYYGGLQPASPLVMDIIALMYWPQRHTGFPRGSEIVHALSDIAGDISLLCPTYAWAQQFAASSNNVYAYYFTQRRFGDPSPEWTGVKHADELPFVFGDLIRTSPFFGFNYEDASLSFIMMTYWANFVKYGDPNGITGVPAKNSLIQMQRWPTMAGNSTCMNRMFEINAMKQVYAMGNADICDLKARECKFWQDFFRKFVGVLANNGQNTTPSRP